VLVTTGCFALITSRFISAGSSNRLKSVNRASADQFLCISGVQISLDALQAAIHGFDRQFN
jgi:hypothetical protein